MSGNPICAWCGYAEVSSGFDKAVCLSCGLSTSMTGERVLSDSMIEKGLTVEDIEVPDPADTGKASIKQEALDRVEAERVERLTTPAYVTDDGELVSNPQSQPAGLVPDNPPTEPTVDTSPTLDTPQDTTPQAGTAEGDEAVRQGEDSKAKIKT